MLVSVYSISFVKSLQLCMDFVNVSSGWDIL